MARTRRAGLHFRTSGALTKARSVVLEGRGRGRDGGGVEQTHNGGYDKSVCHGVSFVTLVNLFHRNRSSAYKLRHKRGFTILGGVVEELFFPQSSILVGREAG